MNSRSDWHKLAAVAALAILVAGCVRRPRVDGDPESRGPRSQDVGRLPDAGRLYQQMGLIAETQGLPFVGIVSYLATPNPDSTLVLVSISLSNAALSFARDGDGYRATYFVRTDIGSGAAGPVRTFDAREVVRVGTFKETLRADESVIFQQQIATPPGNYVITIAVRDDVGGRSGGEEATLNVPRLGDGGLSSPIAFHEARPRARLDSLLHIVSNPRSTAVFGRDSLVHVYLEAYGGAAGAATVPIQVTASGDRGATLWQGTAHLPRSGELYSGSVAIPVAKVGVGVVRVALSRSGGADTVGTPLFVSFGEDLPVATFSDMVSYLRYFTTTERLRALRDTSAEARSAAWLALLRETDPVLSTPEHEALAQYFHRLARANELYRDEGQPGWLTDRGMVFITLGEPDNVFVQSSTADISSRGRGQLWEYREHNLQLAFVDQGGFGRWRLTTASEQQFRALQRRLLAR